MVIIIRFGIPLILALTSVLISRKTPISIVDNFLPSPVIFTSYTATNSGQILVEGKSLFSGKVKIFLNDQEIKKIDTFGNEIFSTEIAINEGENKIFAVAENEKGRFSDNSTAINVNYDRASPLLEINSPSNETKFSGQKDKFVLIFGQTDGVEILANDRKSIIMPDGRFEVTVELNDGQNVVKIIAKNLAGNQTEKEITLFYSP